MDAIIYTTNTGSAERYAKLLAQETGLPVYSFAEAKKQVFSKAKIIYLGTRAFRIPCSSTVSVI